MAIVAGEMAEIPEAILDEIKRRVDLAEIIGEHVALKRSGRGFLGLCPFHQEKSPSFNVNPERGFFHCFGCNAGGNAFTFVMRMTGTTFPEAARALAARCGVEIPETSRAAEGLDRLAEVNELAGRLFAEVLATSPRGEPGRVYLEKRGLSRETVERFGIGFAPGEAWVEELEKRGAARRDLVASGLLRAGREGRPVPLFRHRLVFPIRALGGRIVGFGGRLIADEPGPKYINTPETPLYRKGHHLYGLDIARDAVRSRGRVVLVEGYMDAVALAQAGLGEVAAVLGTAVTPDQLRLARRFAERIVVCFDGDEAGRRAALRVFPLCVDQVDLWPEAVFLPSGEDPDTLVRAGGLPALEATLAAARPLADIFLDDIAPPGSGLREQTRAAQRMAELLPRVQEPRVRDKLVRGAAFRLGVSPAALLAPTRRDEPGRQSGAVSRPAFCTTGTQINFSSEAEIVELALCHPGIAVRVREEDIALEIADPALRALLERILDRHQEPGVFEPAEMLVELPPTMAERVSRRLAVQGGGQEEMAEAGEQWFSRRAERAVRRDRQLLIERLRTAQARGDAAEVEQTLDALRRDRASSVREGASSVREGASSVREGASRAREGALVLRQAPVASVLPEPAAASDDGFLDLDPGDEPVFGSEDDANDGSWEPEEF